MPEKKVTFIEPMVLLRSSATAALRDCTTSHRPRWSGLVPPLSPELQTSSVRSLPWELTLTASRCGHLFQLTLDDVDGMEIKKASNDYVARREADRKPPGRL